MKGHVHALMLRKNDDDEDSDSGGSGNSSNSDSENSQTASRSQQSAAMHFLCKPFGRSLLLLGLWVAVGFVGLTLLLERDEKLSWTDSIYLMCQIITTVGYGDLAKPETPFELLFYMVYVLAACLLIAQIVGSFLGKAFEPAHEDRQPGRQETIRINAHWWRNPRLIAFMKALLLWVGFVVSWAVFFVFWPGEENTWIEATYMGVITLTTVGFGDYVPQTQGGKLFSSLWMVMGTVAFSMMIGKFGVWTFFMFNRMSVEKLDSKALKKMTQSQQFKGVAEARATEIERLFKDFADGKHEEVTKAYTERISRNDFLMFMILDMQLVDQEMVDLFSQHFDELDLTGEGYIDKEDLEQARQTEEQFLKDHPSSSLSHRNLGEEIKTLSQKNVN